MGGYESRDCAEGWNGDISRVLEDWGYNGIYNSVFEFDRESGKIRWFNFEIDLARDFPEYFPSRLGWIGR